ncbi:MAG: hypothetical protein F6K23_23880 [Okeania sp. SIO2C9]|uniref:hypothetical protein n=1 Tax=Okeania sp. SIO2C9 TaxID=2607791 RepID=UPI0013C25C33|nr:hypothetical protein [Okeania sp. SIO2C9]NEQ75810.1 hypothetical protein [Okeania sp. SIO2C9]
MTIGNRQQATGNRQQATGNRDRAISFLIITMGVGSVGVGERGRGGVWEGWRV